MTKDIEKKAIIKLEEASRKALDENTMLLRQVFYCLLFISVASF